MKAELLVDDGLALVEPPERVPALGPQPDGLALAAPAGDAAFLVEGELAAVAGPQTGALERVVIGEDVVAAALETGGRPVNVVCTPGLVRRELVGEGGTRLETVLAFPTLPIVAAQWSSPAPPRPLTLSLTVLPDAGRVAYRTGDAGAVFARATADVRDGLVDGAAGGSREPAADGGGPAANGDAQRASAGGPGASADDRDVVALGVRPAPRVWSVCPGLGGGARVTVELDPTETVTLLVAAGRTGEVRSAFTAARHLGAHARQAAEGAAEGFTLVAGGSDVGDAVAWARTRLRTSLLRLRASEVRDRASREEVFWCGLGATAASDVRAAERALELLEAAGGGSRAALLAARIALVFGRQTAALRHAAALLDEPPDTERRAGSAGLRAYALASLADALRYAAPESTIEELRAAARRLRGGPDRPGAGKQQGGSGHDAAGSKQHASGPGHPGGGKHHAAGPGHDAASSKQRPGGSKRQAGGSGQHAAGSKRLPVVGSGGGPPGFADWLGRALSGAASDEGRSTTGHRPLDAALTAWSAFRREPDVAWAAWGIHAARGLSAPDGPGTWDAPDRLLRVPGRTAGALLAALAHGFLRLVPDAPAGRLGIGPCVGTSLDRFRADGIALGGALLRLDYERDGPCHRFALSAVGARVPPLVVFDPIVTGVVRSARIDGDTADLDLEPLGPATRAPVQLSLDATRTVELFVEDAPGG